MAGLLAVFALSAAVLFALHRAQDPAVPGAAAIAMARHDPAVSRILRAHQVDHVAVDAGDADSDAVTFFDGGRALVSIAVTRHGAVRTMLATFGRGWHPYGDWIAYEPAVLGGLALVFLLTTLVVPLRDARNLDALALLSLTATVLLFEGRFFQWQTVAAVPPLLLLGSRAAWRALGAGPGRPAPATPLYLWLTRRLEPEVRVRLLRMVLGALALIFLAVGVSSPGPVDVAYAVMEGATRLIHGALPYGYPADIFHGDTYPPLSYALYTPLAALWPVRSSWDSVDPALALAVLAALGGAVLLGRSGRSLAGLLAGVRCLAFPPLLVVVSTGTTDPALALLLVSAVLLVRRPGRSTALLAAAGWFKLAPFALVPLWIAPLRGRQLARALGAVAAVSALTLGGVAALGGLAGVAAMVHAVAFQFRRGAFQSVWGALGIEGLQPLAQAATVTLIAGGAWRLRRLGAGAVDPERMAALSAAVLIALELSADYWAFLYLAWIVPLLAMPGAIAPAPEAVDHSSVAVEESGWPPQMAAADYRYV